jgi:preprotein translocase subunit SecA
MFNLLLNRKARNLKRYKRQISNINHMAKEMMLWSDIELQSQTNKLRKRLQGKEVTTADLLPEAFATIKEACRRVLGINLFDIQLVGGIILHQGKIAEMKTGEGKTVVATLPAYLNALTQKGVHIVTVNDYLAKRDAEWIGRIYQFLGMTVGLVQQNMNAKDRQLNYAMDITYITNSELGFDYLRDNMAIDKKDLVQRTFNFCIVDEVDSILIDEARTPLIISGPSQVSTDKYVIANKLSEQLEQNIHYEVDEKTRNITLMDNGIIYCENYLCIDNIYQIDNAWAQYILNTLKAKELFVKNQHYIIRNDEVIIVDEFTGRVMPGRRWSDGLHQAIEAKEHVDIQNENQTLASITYQNFFLMYKKLSGMTGTAKTEEQEFEKIYKVEVVEVPTNKDTQRHDLPDLVYKREYNKWIAIANECYDMYQLGRPTLIGTTNVEKSELLARMLDEYDLPYNLLNAKPENVEREADIIAQAGKAYALTIATNMAGRGTDIILGGNMRHTAKTNLVNTIKEYFIDNITQDGTRPSRTCTNQELCNVIPILKQDAEFLKITENDIGTYIDKCLNSKNRLSSTILALQSVYSMMIESSQVDFEQDRAHVLKAGGLHVIGTERHESRRIDNQLRGRAGRQGDPGSSRFFLSLEDNLLRIFGGDKIYNLMETLKIDNDTPIESQILSSSLNNAQKKVESYYYDIRKQLFEYDEVLNNQRQAIYAERSRILNSSYIRDCILEYGESTIDEILIFYYNDNPNTLNTISQKIQNLLNLPTGITQELLLTMKMSRVKSFLYEQLRITYDLREAYLEQLRPGLVRQLEKYYLLQQIDKAWQEHLEKMANLRESIGWRSYGQQDPLTEYKNEAFSLFINMITYIRETVVYLIMRSRLVVETNRLLE